jgi:hypothetical protein
MQYTISMFESKVAYQAAIIENQQRFIDTMAMLLVEEEIIFYDEEDGNYKYVASGENLLEGE